MKRLTLFLIFCLLITSVSAQKYWTGYVTAESNYDFTDVLQLGETRGYSENGLDYEIALTTLSKPKVKVSVDGEVTDTLVEGQTTELSDGSKISVVLLSERGELKVSVDGELTDVLLEGETTTFSEGRSLTYLLTSHSDRKVKFTVNGEMTNALEVGDSHALSDGSTIKVIEILSDIVEFTFNVGTENEEIMNIDIIIAVDENSPVDDVKAATELQESLERDYVDGTLGRYKLFREVKFANSENSLIIIIDQKRALTVVGNNAPVEYVKVATRANEVLQQKGYDVKSVLTSEAEGIAPLELLNGVFGEVKTEAKEEKDGIEKEIELYESNTCEDTDNGLDIHERGECSTGSRGLSDYCDYSSGRAGVLKEASCSDDGCRRENVACLSGEVCRGGECVKGSPSDPICVETDGGKDEYNKGITFHKRNTGNTDTCYVKLPNSKFSGTMTPTCAAENNGDQICGVYEYYCINDDYGDAVFLECTYGCLDGECTKEPIDFLGSDLWGYLVEGESETYNVGGEEYEVILEVLDGRKAKFIIQGVITEFMEVQEEILFADGKALRVLGVDPGDISDTDQIRFSFVRTDANLFQDSTDEVKEKKSSGDPTETSLCPTVDCHEPKDGCYYESDNTKDANGCPIYPCGVQICDDEGFSVGEVETCNGCSVGDSCVFMGTRLESDDSYVFCGIKGLENQKYEGVSCQNDYECLTNECSSGKCIDLQKQLEEQNKKLEEQQKKLEEQDNTLQKILGWLSSWFG